MPNLHNPIVSPELEERHVLKYYFPAGTLHEAIVIRLVEQDDVLHGKQRQLCVWPHHYFQTRRSSSHTSPHLLGESHANDTDAVAEVASLVGEMVPPRAEQYNIAVACH